MPITFHVSPKIAAESDPGPYPIPPTRRVEGGGDHHVLILRQGDCRLFELYDATKQPDDGWSVYSAATFDLRSNALRHDGYTSADAAGLPMLPGLAGVDEVRAGAIGHALRIAIPRTQNAYIHPATHAASASTIPALPPMGLRLRLKAGYDISGLHGQARVIARALQVYGALVADNSGGSKVFISGTPDPGWDDDDLDQLKAIPASALEAVVTGPVPSRLARRLHQADGVARRVAEGGVDAVGALRGLLAELDAAALELLVAGPAVVGREEQAAGGALGHQSRSLALVSASKTGGPGGDMRARAMSGWPTGPTVSQRKPPSSGRVTSSRSSMPSFCGVEGQRLVLVVDPDVDVGELLDGHACLRWWTVGAPR